MSVRDNTLLLLQRAEEIALCHYHTDRRQQDDDRGLEHDGDTAASCLERLFDTTYVFLTTIPRSFGDQLVWFLLCVRPTVTTNYRTEYNGIYKLFKFTCLVNNMLFIFVYYYLVHSVRV